MTKSSTLDRLLAIVLALLMMVSLMPVQAFADVEETPVEEVVEDFLASSPHDESAKAEAESISAQRSNDVILLSIFLPP